MGLTKQYLRYAPNSAFGLIASPKGGIVSLGDKNLAAVAAAENVLIWNLKTGEKAAQFTLTSGNHGDVTALAVSPHFDKLAVGLHDGVIKMFSQNEYGEWDEGTVDYFAFFLRIAHFCLKFGYFCPKFDYFC